MITSQQRADFVQEAIENVMQARFNAMQKDSVLPVPVFEYIANDVEQQLMRAHYFQGHAAYAAMEARFNLGLLLLSEHCPDGCEDRLKVLEILKEDLIDGKRIAVDLG